MQMGDKDQSLWDDDDLEVDNHVQLFVIVIDGLTGWVSEPNIELVLEESGVDDNSNESNANRICQYPVRPLRDGSQTYVDAVR